MMTGSSFVRASARNCFANARPDWPGSIQSSSSEVRQRSLEQRLRRLGVRSGAHVVARVDQVDLEELEDRRLVLDDEDGGHHRSASLTPPTSARICSAVAWRTSMPFTTCTTASAMFFA